MAHVVSPGMKNLNAPIYSDLAKMSRCQLSEFYYNRFVGAAINDGQCRNTPAETTCAIPTIESLKKCIHDPEVLMYSGIFAKCVYNVYIGLPTIQHKKCFCGGF